MRDFTNYEFSENEYIEIHDTYEDNSIIDTYNENDFEVEVEEVKIDDTYTEWEISPVIIDGGIFCLE